ncbi:MULTISPECIES: hypothetical protein [Rhizobium/Agrobacterium group]|uniref:Uncharacterized protein n=2 Tax=Rhizobium/Agrobacterium group TaxID=227290 RepID=B9K497_ALLAM|nr:MULTISPECIES: hypothetical protein [Rhizobium/Agrobacterium group]ACM39547.1 hypothetical protein Avi_8005 [Allorhizobium ampelinum S4]ASK49775.1 hypothetical protein [Agrobacterium vitis]MCF1436629.1 hypothetical protein [Allorhizobium ampelinum]MCF1495893.1 hypothetical protein [Allorhizobium ampelinum]MUO31387.1 hypothetical protein [Agrobacterium vitis]
MFITNALSPAETLAEILQKNSSIIADTDWFKTKKHDADLCPMFESLGVEILQSYKAYRAGCHDIQGMRDDGVDILLKYDSEDGATKIGLQIKSYPEFQDWVAKEDKTFMKTLKSQYTEAMQNVGVEHYFLILCTDAHEHRKQIRMISAELKNFANLTIVKPVQVRGFTLLSHWELQATVTRLLCQDDPVLNAARECFSDLATLDDYMTLDLLCRAFGGANEPIDNGDLEDIAEQWTELAGGARDMDEVADALGFMESSGYLRYVGERYVIVPEEFPNALCAIYFDLRARNGLAADDALAYLVPLLLNIP